MSLKVKPDCVMAAEVVRPGQWVAAPYFAAKMECIGPGQVTKWVDGFTHNVVVDQGKAWLLNRVFGSRTASTAGCFLYPHSYATASDHVWSSVSGSRLTGFGNDVPRISLTATTYTQASQTMSASFGFNATATVQTVLGAAVLFYTAGTMSTNAAAADVAEYSEGQFGTTRTVSGAETLNVTLTAQFV